MAWFLKIQIEFPVTEGWILLPLLVLSSIMGLRVEQCVGSKCVKVAESGSEWIYHCLIRTKWKGWVLRSYSCLFLPNLLKTPMIAAHLPSCCGRKEGHSCFWNLTPSTLRAWGLFWRRPQISRCLSEFLGGWRSHKNSFILCFYLLQDLWYFLFQVWPEILQTQTFSWCYI